MANKQPVAYVPLTTAGSNLQIQGPTKIDTPDYPDEGVSFAKFSKTLISNNQYKLNPQQPHVSWSFSSLPGAGTNVNFVKAGSVIADKDFYVTDMTLSLYTTYAGATVCSYLNIRDGVGGAVRCVLLEKTNTAGANFNNYTIHFDVPVKFSKEQPYINFNFGVARIIGDVISFTFSGWAE